MNPRAPLFFLKSPAKFPDGRSLVRFVMRSLLIMAVLTFLGLGGLLHGQLLVLNYNSSGQYVDKYYTTNGVLRSAIISGISEQTSYGEFAYVATSGNYIYVLIPAYSSGSTYPVTINRYDSNGNLQPGNGFPITRNYSSSMSLGSVAAAGNNLFVENINSTGGTIDPGL
jgi:hypothetical protein